MADTERRVTRRESITTVVEIDGKDVLFLAQPLPWRKRNDFGDVLVRSYSAAFNQILSGVNNEAGELIGLNGTLFESAMDYPALLALAYPNVKDEDLEALDFEQMLEVLIASLEVNGLSRLDHMLDPDRKKDLPTGESEEESAPITDGEKTELATVSG